VFDGFWRVTVLGAPQLMDSYPSKYRTDGKLYTPAGPNDMLVLIPCRLKNGMKTPQARSCGDDTALTDDQGHSYPPHGFDMRFVNASYSADILPGATLDAVMVFSVPKGTTLKDVVITTGNYLPHNKPSNVRISLTP
jgi:hypothetical protein